LLLHPPAKLVPDPKNLNAAEIIAAVNSYLRTGFAYWRGTLCAVDSPTEQLAKSETPAPDAPTPPSPTEAAEAAVRGEIKQQLTAEFKELKEQLAKPDEPRVYRIIRRLAGEEFPLGWKDVPTADIFYRIADKFKQETGHALNRYRVERALGRRTD
jgi:hypothetical protein